MYVTIQYGCRSGSEQEDAIVELIRKLYAIGPLLFAAGFLTPLIAQIMERSGWTAPWGLSPLLFGLILAAVWGGLAQWRGRWV